MELNAAATVQGTPSACQSVDGQCLHSFADNVDHNIATLDWHGTFHFIITIVTCKASNRHSQENVNIKDIREAGSVKMLHHSSGHNGLSSLMYHDLRQHDTQDPISRLAMQWKLSSVLINRRLVLSRTLIVFCVIKIITIDLCI